MELAGGAKAFLSQVEREPARFMVVVTANASTDAISEIDATTRQPPIKDTVGAISDVQLHRYNVATIELTERMLERWAAEDSTPERPVESYFFRLSFADLPEDQQPYFNAIRTSFALTDEQVTRLIEAGRWLLRNNAEFQLLMKDLGRQDGHPRGG
ncbi:MAG: hypothetical protein R3F35_05095 [Myxococcota bacterium]